MEGRYFFAGSLAKIRSNTGMRPTQDLRAGSRLKHSNSYQPGIKTCAALKDPTELNGESTYECPPRATRWSSSGILVGRHQVRIDMHGISGMDLKHAVSRRALLPIR